MNNTPTLRWLISICTMLAFSALTNQAVAQCTISSPPEPIQLQLILNPLTGTADLLRTTVSPYITGSGAPGCNATNNIRFFYNSAKTLPTTAGLTSITYGCGDANGIATVYVAVASNPANPATFSAAVRFQITILDYTAPDAVTGPDVLTFTDPGACTAGSIGFIDLIPVPKTLPLALNPREFTDNCIANLEVGYILTGATILPYTVGADAGVETFNTGVTNVTYFITDLQYAGSGSASASVSFNVTVTDLENPTITCPADKNVSTDPGVCQYKYVGLAATGTDNCVGTTIENSVNNTNSLVGETFSTGTTPVTWTITDAHGNIATCVQTIKVSDNENPKFSHCPANITVSADPFTCDYTIGALNPGEFDATATDNCGVTSLTNDVTGTNILDGSILSIGLSTITWTAIDNAGNLKTCVFGVTVIDDTAPSVMASNNSITVSVNSSSCDKVITWTRPSIGVPFDCGSVTMSETFVSGPDNTVLNGLPAFNPLTGGGSVTTNFPAGTTVIRYSWIDDSPYSPDFSVLYTFTVLEDIAPTAKCKDVTVQLNNNGIATLSAAQADNGSYDNCPLGLTVTVSAPNGSPVSGSSIQFDCSDLNMQPMNGWPFTLTALDANMNSNTTNCRVTILDTQKPLVTCPSNITVNASATCTASIGTAGNMTPGIFPNAGQYDDNCTITQIVVTANNGADLDNTIALVQSSLTINGNDPTASLSGAVFQKGTTNVVYTIKDQASNTEVCSFNIIVNDNTPPTTTSTLCNSTIVKNINTVSCAYIPTPGNPIWVNPTWTENCGTFAVVTTGGTPTSPFPQGSTNIVITATDQSGNVGTCSFVVKVQDFVAPDAKCNNLTVNLSGPTTITALQVNNNSTDNCTFPANLTYDLFELNGTTPLVQPFTCSNVPSKKVVLKVTDFDNNSDTCQATIKVIDNIAPICNAQPVTVALNASGTATLTAAALNNSSTDNCSGLNLTKEVSKSPSGPWTSSITYNCADRTSGSNPAKTAYLRVTDASTPSNSTVCNNLITIIDNIPPVGNGPDDITLECSAVNAYLAQPVTITAVENCTYTVSAPTQTTTPLTNPICANHYKITRSWIVTDAAGLTDLIQQVITVEDNTEPVVNITNFTPGIEEVVPNEEYKIYLSDYSSLAFPFDACYPQVTFNFTSTDNCSTVVEDWTVSYADDGFGPYADQTGTGSVVQSPFVTGDNFITFNLTDACGNATQLVVLVTVIDDVAPKFSSYLLPAPNPTNISYCNRQFVYPNAPGTCGYTFQWIRPWYGDIEECNNAGTDLVFAPESIVANGNQNISANFPWDPSNGITELIPVSVTLPVGTTIFRYVVTDQSANTSTCSFTVKVNDTQPPVLTGIQTAILNTICPTQQIPDYTGLVNVIDNCPSSVVLTQFPAVGTQLSAITTYTTPGPNPADGSQFTVTITATDASGSPATRNIVVTLDDNTAPIPNQTSLADQLSNCGFIILSAPTAKPNCTNGPIIYGTPGGVNATPETVIGTTITSYRVTLSGSTCQTYFVTWSYNDGNGNVSTQLQKVTICPDVAPPVAICKTGVTNIILSPNSATLAPATVDGDNGSFSINGSHDPDLCSAVPTTAKVALSLSQSVYTCADLGKTTVTLKATDNAGNTATCIAQIKVIDNIAPVISTISLPANDTVEVCLETIPDVPALPSVLDNCSATVSLSENSTKGSTGATKYNYVITRTWTATDTYGNTSTVSRTILVRDTKKPVFTAPTPASLVFHTDPGDPDCSGTTKFNVANYVQDCAPDAELTISSSPAYFSFSDTTEILPVGTHVVTFTATDPSGNTATMSITLVVNDLTKPVASCINGISISLNQNGQAIVT
ncbi:MAG: HYR domain-containing protein, partial [Bacteroidota bacterium]